MDERGLVLSSVKNSLARRSTVVDCDGLDLVAEFVEDILYRRWGIRKRFCELA
jgi:hypothetical protein